MFWPWNTPNDFKDTDKRLSLHTSPILSVKLPQEFLFIYFNILLLTIGGLSSSSLLTQEE